MDQNENEHHKYLRLRCQLDVEDVTMVEERTWSNNEMIQKRLINDKFIIISKSNGNKTTTLTQEEEDEFEEKWKRLWNLKIFDDIQAAINTETDVERLKDKLKQVLSNGQI